MKKPGFSDGFCWSFSNVPQSVKFIWILSQKGWKWQKNREASLIDTVRVKQGTKKDSFYGFEEAFEIDLSHEFQLYTFNSSRQVIIW